MKNYYIISLLLFLILTRVPCVSQVTIGSISEPDSNALLDLKETAEGTSNKGLLLPRVKLVSLDNPSPLSSHIEGMIVYNILDINILPTGLYFNNGTKWVPLSLPEPGEKGQVLMISEESYTPQWTTIEMPSTDKEEYNLILQKAFSIHSNTIFGSNSGANIYNTGDTKSGGWQTISERIPITVNTSENRLIVLAQVLVEQDPHSDSGWLSYAGGIFLNNKLRSVRVGVLNSLGDNQKLSKMETLFFILENLPLGANSIEIAFIRRNSSPTKVPSLKILGETSISLQYSEKEF